MNNRLTLNLGFRYQYMQPQYAALQNGVLWLPQYFDPQKAPAINRSNGAILPGNYDPYNGLALGGTEFPEAANEPHPTDERSGGEGAVPRPAERRRKHVLGYLGTAPWLRSRSDRHAEDRAARRRTACSTNASKATSFSARSTTLRSSRSPTFTTATWRIPGAARRKRLPGGILQLALARHESAARHELELWHPAQARFGHDAGCRLRRFQRSQPVPHV